MTALDRRRAGGTLTGRCASSTRRVRWLPPTTTACRRSSDSIRIAREQLILRRETHLEQLTDTLQEERVRQVIGPLLSGSDAIAELRSDDLQYVRDLGLVARDDSIRIANPIYREVIPRDLTWTIQAGFTHDPAWYVDAEGNLQLRELLAAFQGFFREHSEHWLERFRYR